MARNAVVAVFDDRNKAYDTATAIGRINDEMFDVKQGAIVTKDAKGNASVADSESFGAPWGLVGGPIVGGLVGLLGGPPGVAIGAVTGGFIGWIHDLGRLGLAEDWVSDVTHQMKPGQAALVLEVEEGSTEPLDAAARAPGGRVYRTDVWS